MSKRVKITPTNIIRLMSLILFLIKMPLTTISQIHTVVRGHSIFV